MTRPILPHLGLDADDAPAPREMRCDNVTCELALVIPNRDLHGEWCPGCGASMASPGILPLFVGAGAKLLRLNADGRPPGRAVAYHADLLAAFNAYTPTAYPFGAEVAEELRAVLTPTWAQVQARIAGGLDAVTLLGIAEIRGL